MKLNWSHIKTGGNLLIFSALLAALIAGCGGGGSGGETTSNSNATTQGTVYPVVVNLAYQTDSSSGVVASDGSYTYKTNENVTFSVGGIEVASVPAAAQVTPLPLDNDVASSNLLRLLKAMDTDGNLTNGTTLPQLPSSTLTSIDLTSEASVAAALTSLVPTATLPAAGDAQVTSTLADAKTTALQNLGTFGSTYKTIIVTQWTTITNPAPFPKDAVVNLTTQPNWATGVVDGTATLTLSDNSTVTFPLTSKDGTYTAAGITMNYSLSTFYSSTTRVIQLTVSNILGRMSFVLRDNSQPNKAPVPVFYPSFTPSLSAGAPRTYNFISNPVGPGSVVNGAKDFDGIVVSQSWVSSKGKTGTGNAFSESFYPNESGSITLTATDDEGASASKTYTVNVASPSTVFMACNIPAFNGCVEYYVAGINCSTGETQVPFCMPTGVIKTCTVPGKYKQFAYTGAVTNDAQCTSSGGVIGTN